MSAKQGKRAKSGESAFNAYYEELYGERWAALKAALASPNARTAWRRGLLQPYFLDAGSILAACALPLEGASSILDLCAAPGGKTLVLASRMDAAACLAANERSRERKDRLLRVLDDHLPPVLRSRVRVTGNDGARWCRYETEAYDRILLDAPCSSERHVLADPKYLSQWTPSRVKNLAIKQWALLSSAFLVLKSGGLLLYATCALAAEENDGVVKKIFAKYKTAQAMQPDFAGFESFGVEKTAYGYHVLPDRQNGAGPLFFSLIAKSPPDGQLDKVSRAAYNDLHSV